jgi:hypothetical protein
MVIVTRYVSGAEWLPRRMSPGQMVLALMENTLAVRTRPADTLRILGVAAADALAFQGERGDAASIAEEMLARCPTSSR